MRRKFDLTTEETLDSPPPIKKAMTTNPPEKNVQVVMEYQASDSSKPYSVQKIITVLRNISMNLKTDSMRPHFSSETGSMVVHTTKVKKRVQLVNWLPFDMSLNQLVQCEQNVERYILNKENDRQMKNLIVSMYPAFKEGSNSIKNIINHMSQVEICKFACLCGVFPFQYNLKEPQEEKNLANLLYDLCYAIINEGIFIEPRNRGRKNPLTSSLKSKKEEILPPPPSISEAFDMKKTQDIRDLLATGKLLPKPQCPVFVKFKFMKPLGVGNYGLAIEANFVNKPQDIEFDNLVIKLYGFEDNKDTKPMLPEYEELRIHHYITECYVTNATRFRKICPIIKLYDWTKCKLNLFSVFHPDTGDMPMTNADYTKYIKKNQKFQAKEVPIQTLLIEYANKGTLLNYLQSKNTGDVFWTKKQFSSFMIQIVAPLYQLNTKKKFSHGDLHPENVLLESFDSTVITHLHYTYKKNGHFYVPLSRTENIVTKLNDFGFSTMEEIDKKDGKVIRFGRRDGDLFSVPHTAEMAYASFSPSYDLQKLAGSLLYRILNRINEVQDLEENSGIPEDTSFIPHPDVLDFLSHCIYDKYDTPYRIKKMKPREANEALRTMSQFVRDIGDLKKCLNQLKDYKNIGLPPNKDIMKAIDIAGALTRSPTNNPRATTPRDILIHPLFDEYRTKPKGITENEIIDMDIIGFTDSDSEIERSTRRESVINISDDDEEEEAAAEAINILGKEVDDKLINALNNDFKAEIVKENEDFIVVDVDTLNPYVLQTFDVLFNQYVKPINLARKDPKIKADNLVSQKIYLVPKYSTRSSIISVKDTLVRDRKKIITTWMTLDDPNFVIIKNEDTIKQNNFSFTGKVYKAYDGDGADGLMRAVSNRKDLILNWVILQYYKQPKKSEEKEAILVKSSPSMFLKDYIKIVDEVGVVQATITSGNPELNVYEKPSEFIPSKFINIYDNDKIDGTSTVSINRNLVSEKQVLGSNFVEQKSNQYIGYTIARQDFSLSNEMVAKSLRKVYWVLGISEKGLIAAKNFIPVIETNSITLAVHWVILKFYELATGASTKTIPRLKIEISHQKDFIILNHDNPVSTEVILDGNVKLDEYRHADNFLTEEESIAKENTTSKLIRLKPELSTTEKLLLVKTKTNNSIAVVPLYDSEDVEKPEYGIIKRQNISILEGNFSYNGKIYFVLGYNSSRILAMSNKKKLILNWIYKQYSNQIKVYDVLFDEPEVMKKVTIPLMKAIDLDPKASNWIQSKLGEESTSHIINFEKVESYIPDICTNDHNIGEIVGKGSFGRTFKACFEGDCNRVVKIVMMGHHRSDEVEQQEHRFLEESEYAYLMGYYGIGPKVFDYWLCTQVLSKLVSRPVSRAGLISMRKYDITLPMYVKKQLAKIAFGTPRKHNDERQRRIDKFIKEIKKVKKVTIHKLKLMASIEYRGEHFVHGDMHNYNIMVNINELPNGDIDEITDVVLIDFMILLNSNHLEDQVDTIDENLDAYIEEANNMNTKKSFKEYLL